uniref:LAGLIDADG homing endonuclease n=1 Tax=Tricholoma saponaceum TaxID=113602 RepID=A0A6C0W4E7_9AGAR|nr:LAGLIDADG homing endonuclease [Tricholoma saponaceum]QIC20309.1 LAGLIDADG homing endonuclease [Tricholoma saponaceum]
MKKLINSFFNIKSGGTKYLKHKLFDYGNPDVTLIKTRFDKEGRYFTFTLTNYYLLDNKQILRAIFIFLKSYPRFVEIKDHINTNYSNDSTYPSEMIPLFEILVWNMDDLRNYHIKIIKSMLSNYKMKQRKTNYGFLKSFWDLMIPKINIRGYHTNNISPIKTNIPVQPSDFAAMDLETMEFNRKQIPVARSIVCEEDKQLFVIKLPEQLDINSVNKAVEELWSDFLHIFLIIIT